MKLVKNENEKISQEISDKEAEEAFIKILKWIGEDPSREGLLETPRRVMNAFREYFNGYNIDSKQVLMWKKFCVNRCENFINYFPFFFTELDKDGFINTYKKYYWWNDVHFNKKGNEVIAEKLIEVF